MGTTAQVAKNLSQRRAERSQPSERSAGASRRALHALPKSVPNASDHAMLRWLDKVVRHHLARHGDAIVALKTVAHPDCCEAVPALYVWEVTGSRSRGGVEWLFAVWDVAGCGVRFLECATREDAMRLYDLPIAEGLAAVADAPGVRIRPGCGSA